MPLTLVLALQAAAPMLEGAEAERFDLKDFETGESEPPRLGEPITTRCAEVAPGEILVCGSRGGSKQYRIQPLPPGFASEGGLPKAEMGLGGGVTGRVYVESVGMPDGQISKRIMIGIGTKF
jgi:hypothetical protein